MTGRPGINFVNSVVAVALYIGLGVWIVPTHGAFGMAVVDAVVTAIINTVRVIEAKLVVGIHPFGRSLLKPITATAGTLLTVLLALHVAGSGELAAIASLVLGGVVYIAVLKKLGLDPEERQVWERIRQKTRSLMPTPGP